MRIRAYALTLHFFFQPQHYNCHPTFTCNITEWIQLFILLYHRGWSQAARRYVCSSLPGIWPDRAAKAQPTIPSRTWRRRAAPPSRPRISPALPRCCLDWRARRAPSFRRCSRRPSTDCWPRSRSALCPLPRSSGACCSPRTSTQPARRSRRLHVCATTPAWTSRKASHVPRPIQPCSPFCAWHSCFSALDGRFY